MRRQKLRFDKVVDSKFLGRLTIKDVKRKKALEPLQKDLEAPSYVIRLHNITVLAWLGTTVLAWLGVATLAWLGVATFASLGIAILASLGIAILASLGIPVLTRISLAKQKSIVSPVMGTSVKFWEFVLPKKVFDSVCVDTIGDIREEYYEALYNDRIWKARTVYFWGQLALYYALVTYTVMKLPLVETLINKIKT